MIHKICTNRSNGQYRGIKKQCFPYICLCCQSNTFLFSEQSNSGFNNSLFSKDTNIFPDENLNSFLTESNYIETPFNDSDHPVFIDSKYYDIHYFNKLNINKNSSFATFHLNIVSLSKYFDDLQIFLSLLKHYFDIISISELKINKIQ